MPVLWLMPLTCVLQPDPTVTIEAPMNHPNGARNGPYLLRSDHGVGGRLANR